MNVLPLPTTRPSLTIMVPGRPESWGVVTVVRNNRPAVNLNKKSAEYQKRVAAAAHAAARGRQVTTACRVDYVIVFPRLKRHKNKPGRHRFSVAPDYDRVLRNINDGLQRCQRGWAKPKSKPDGGWRGVVVDDSLIVEGSFSCWYADENEEAHTMITISPVR